jgi:hypothetical protein
MPAIGGGSQGAEALLAEPVAASLARPSWQAAQTYAGDELKSFGFREQPSYLEVKLFPMGHAAVSGPTWPASH